MMPKARPKGLDLLLIIVTLAAAFLIDVALQPRDQFVSAPFAVPILIAANRLPPRGATAITVLTFGFACLSAYLDGAPVVPALFHLLGLLVIGILAILLGNQRRVSARLNQETQDLLCQVQAREESLARAQEVAQIGNWDRDLRTGQLYWSAEIYRIFGITPEEFGGTLEDFLQRVHPDDRARVTRTIQEGLKAGRAYRFDSRIVRPDGEVRMVHNEMKVIRDEAGRAVQTVGTVQDITERKRAEEERERLLQQVQVERARVEAILNSTANAILYIDAASGTVQANPAAVQLFGHPFVPEAGSAQYQPQVLHPDGRPFAMDELPSRGALHRETTRQVELLVVQPDGDRIPVLESAAPVCDPEGQVVGAVVVFQDISALKEVERLREEWTSVVAHDLRQPVTVISGYVSLLEMKSAALPTGHRELEHIQTAARNLTRMIEDLLDVSRIEARRLVLRLQPVDLPSLVPGVVERLATVTVGHPVHIDVEQPIERVFVDPARIEQVLGNLLSNAAKYSDPTSEICVRVCQRDREGLVSVVNQGPGIPADELPHLFARFYRTPEARGGPQPGLGVGLYISKGLVEAHGGRIWAESIPGQTTTFTIALPITRENNPTHTP